MDNETINKLSSSETRGMEAPAVGEPTAHLFNAARLLELATCEVYRAFEHLGEDYADRNSNVFAEGMKDARDCVDDWVLERLRDWTAAIERPATI